MVTDAGLVTTLVAQDDKLIIQIVDNKITKVLIALRFWVSLILIRL